ncbi:GFA family protein [Kribbella sp. NPDC056345]|uniref:GFA family protein n=1 Tax=Kribbella sp. NPDC056345 TaxID=3345789 RepID=UPI0035E1C8B0
MPPFSIGHLQTVNRQRTGHCLCGPISYRFDADPEAVVLCHCGECQRHSGSAFSVNVLVPRAALEITGTPATYQTTGTENGHLRDPHPTRPRFDDDTK